MRITLLLVLGLALAAPAGARGKDLMLRQRVYGTGGPKAGREQTQYFSGDKIVIASPGQRAIVDLAARTWTVIEPEKRTYSVRTFDDLRRAGERATKALEGLPPETRKRLGVDTPVSVQATGKSEKSAGYTAKEYAVSGGAASGTVWLTEELAVPAEAREWERLSSPATGPGAALAAEMAKLKGVPLRTSLT